eukprot:scaffold20632_cov63-Phaeocystis_antarctica.AAC.3
MGSAVPRHALEHAACGPWCGWPPGRLAKLSGAPSNSPLGASERAATARRAASIAATASLSAAEATSAARSSVASAASAAASRRLL